MRIQRNTHRRHIVVVSLVCIVFLSVLFTSTYHRSVPLAHAASGLTFSKLTDHPYASKSGYLQADGSVAPAGREIRNMVITSDGTLIAGYGDAGRNSDSWGVPEGRVGVVPYNIATNTWGSITYAGSEAIDTIRQINGALYIPTIDPSIYGVGGYLTNKSGTWQRISTVPDAVHIFDIATSNGSDLLLFGAADPNGVSSAMVWRSTDNGATWSAVMTDTSTPDPGGMERYYWGVNYNGSAYTQASSTYPQTPTRVLSGSTGVWAETGDTNFDAGESTTLVFDGKIIRGKYDGTISAYDGTTASLVTFANTGEGAVKNLSIDNGYLYVLNDSAVYRTKSLAGPWQRLGSVSSSMMSLAVYGDNVYLGDNAGSIWRSDATISAVVQPVRTCFAFVGGVITGYYDYENNDPASPACPSHVVIPDSIGGIAVTTIGDGAFSGKAFSSVTIPSSVTSIGKEAFMGVGLSSVTLGSGVTTIGERAFVGNNLTSLVVPDSVTEIGKEAFMKNSLASLTLGAGVSRIKTRAFAENNLTNLVIPDSVISISTEAFRKNKLASLSLGDHLSSIGPGAFSYNQLTAVTIPNSVSVIGYDTDMYTDINSSNTRQEGSFEGNHLTSLTFDGSYIWINGPAFALNKLTSVTIPSAIMSVDAEVFMLQNPKGGDALADAGLSNLVDIFQTSNEAVKQTLGTVWYVQLYTQDPSNPNNLKDGIVAYSWTNGINYGGYLVNPASITTNYVDSAGTNIRLSDTYVGDGLTSYLVKDNPYDSLSTDATTTALARYYRLGSTVTITVPAISGYVLGASSSYSVALSKQTTATTFVYITDQSSLNNISTPANLSRTGDNRLVVTGVALTLIVLGAVITGLSTIRKHNTQA